MAAMSMKRLRAGLRATHVVVAVVLAVCVYAVPLVSAQTARTVVAVGIPLLALSGIGLWRQAALRRLMNGRQRAGA